MVDLMQLFATPEELQNHLKDPLQTSRFSANFAFFINYATDTPKIFIHILKTLIYH